MERLKILAECEEKVAPTLGESEQLAPPVKEAQKLRKSLRRLI